MSGFSWADILGDLFGDPGSGGSSRSSAKGRGSQTAGFDFSNLFGGMAGSRSQAVTRPQAGANRDHILTLDFREAVRGLDITMEVDVPVTCGKCQGQGKVGNSGGFKVCQACRGSGSVSEKQTIKAHIPAGVSEGQKLRIRGKGSPGRSGGPPGDLNLIIKIKPDPVFTRDAGNNLLMEQKISLYQALLGGSVEVPTVMGQAALKIPAGTQNGAKFRLKGKGVITDKKSGDLYVTIRVVLPKKLSGDAGELAKKLEELAPVAPEDL
jgi:molecular chaperone DnaJ